MNSNSHTRRLLLRSLFAGLLFTQPALLTKAQNAESAKPAGEAADTAQKKKTDDQPVVLDTFSVSASYAASLAASAEKKEKATVITEVITAEDIGKLPDVSIADSLTHLPGLTTQRTNGRSQAISIRGLTGDFSTGLLNGLQQTSTGMNRAVEYDQYPSELINEVIVSKTAAPNLNNQGLAGTIDLRTVQPLSKDRRIIAVSGFYEWTQLKELTPGASDKGNRLNFAYIDQLNNGTVGVALGFAHTDRPFQGQQFQAWGYPTDGSGNLVLGGTKSYARSSQFIRDSYMGVVEFKPSESVHSSIFLFKSDFEEKQLLRGMEIPLWWSGASATAGYTASGGYVPNMTFTNVQPVVRNDVFRRNAHPLSIGWNLQLGKNSPWPVNIDAGYSKVDRDDFNLETWSGLGIRGSIPTGASADTVSVKLMPGQIPVLKSTLNYEDGTVLKLTDPQGWGPSTLPGNGMYGYLKGFKSDDKLTQLKASAQHELGGVFNRMEIGVSYTDRKKSDGENPSGFIHSPTSQIRLNLPTKVGTTDMGFLGLGKVYAYDPLSAYAAGTWGFTANTDTGIVANRFNISEKVTQGYGQFDIDTKLGGIPLTGNVGARVIRTEQSSVGFSANSNSLNAVTDGDKYTDFAPSLNLVLKPGDQTYVRFSAARQLAPPRMFDMRASRTWGYNATNASSTTNSPWSGGGGNSKLRPWRSNSFDLAIEKYFADSKGYIAITGFHKNLLNYIYEQNSVASFIGYPVPAGSAAPVLSNGLVSQPVNGTGGSMKGVEFAVSLASELISKDVRGFGLELGGAYTDSSVKPWGPTGGNAPIAGLSRKVYSATLYYDRHGFSARISQRYRSEAREYITTFGVPSPGGDVNPNGGFSVAQPETVVDAQVSYALQSGPAKGLTFYFQVYNLNDEPLVTYNNGDPRQVINFQKYGASYSTGVSYKF